MQVFQLPGRYYTTTRENWELRRHSHRRWHKFNYTTTRENWELRRYKRASNRASNYTTTRENWELRPANPSPRRTANYTTTRENWELRREPRWHGGQGDYTTTRENWELRHNIKDEDFSDYKIVVDDYNEIINPLLVIVPMQMLAYNVAKLRGCRSEERRVGKEC